MIKRAIFLAAGAAAVLAVAPAQARDGNGKFASDAIMRGDLGHAEQMLLADARVHPESPQILLNLANVYVRQGRYARAATLYHRVLSLDDVALQVNVGRAVTAHEVALLVLTGIQQRGLMQVSASR